MIGSCAKDFMEPMGPMEYRVQFYDPHGRGLGATDWFSSPLVAIDAACKQDPEPLDGVISEARRQHEFLGPLLGGAR